MCFSAAASFTAGGVLAAVGVVAIAVEGRGRRRLFAMIPLLFAAQQVAEGVVWLAAPPEGTPVSACVPALVFLAVAQGLWPVWLPMSMLALTRDQRHRRILRLLMAIGLAVSAYLIYSLIVRGARVDIVGHHVRYDLRYPPLAGWACRIGYGLATIAPPFCCGRPRVWILGLAVAFAYAASWIWYQYAVISIWCFFSAWLSVLIVWILAERGSEDDGRGGSRATGGRAEASAAG